MVASTQYRRLKVRLSHVKGCRTFCERTSMPGSLQELAQERPSRKMLGKA